MTEPQKLLADYAERGSEAAFRELVTRYINLVYSTALRLVNTDQHRAEDVAQVVFADLAQTARKLPRDVMLGGWLHRHTIFVASNLMRRELRRQIREREAVKMNAFEDQTNAHLAELAPVIDEAIEQLNAEDRTAILLRFFEQLDFRSVGQALGSTEEAARKRVTRALDKLRCLLQHKGVGLSAAALATGLATQTITAAPASLAATVATAALAGVTGGGTAFTLSTLKFAAMTKIRLAAVSAAVIAGLTTPLVIQHQSRVRLRQQHQALQQQADQLAAENLRLSNLVAGAKDAQSLTADQLQELLRLRGEVGRLRNQLREAEQASQESRQLRASAKPPADASARDSSAQPAQRVPRESWAFAGYATPEAALQTMVWAWSNHDMETLLASFSPEGRKNLENELGDKSSAGQALAAFPIDLSKASYYDIKQTETSDNKVSLVVAFELPFQIGYSHHFTMTNLGTEWKADW